MNDHPSREAMHQWLLGKEHVDLDHVEHCATCLSDLDDLSQLDAEVVRSFLDLTRPLPGFMDRMRIAIERRQEEAEAWYAAADLLSLGWHTINAVWNEDG